MRTTRVIGPVTGRPRAAYATGEAWNGAPVMAFTAAQMRALIVAGDGVDSNGYGLSAEGEHFLDVFGPGESERVPTVTAEIHGARSVLYVPGGRMWDEVAPADEVAAASTVPAEAIPSGYEWNLHDVPKETGIIDPPIREGQAATFEVAVIQAHTARRGASDAAGITETITATETPAHLPPGAYEATDTYADGTRLRVSVHPLD